MPTKGLLLFAAAVALVVAAPAAAHLAGTADHISFSDAVGDGDPDITNVTAGSNAGGGLTFVVDIANRTELAPNEFVQVMVDTDLNAATGEPPKGVDFALQMARDDVGLFHWNGSAMTRAEGKTVYGYVYKGFRFGLNRSDLVGTGGTIRYWVHTVSGDKTDDSPDGNVAEYQLSAAPLVLSVAEFGADKTVKVGKLFAMGMRVHRNDLDELTSAGDVRCSAKVGKRAVKIQAVFPADVAGCVGMAPKWAKGKTVTVTVSLELDGKTITRSAKIKVR